MKRSSLIQPSQKNRSNGEDKYLSDGNLFPSHKRHEPRSTFDFVLDEYLPFFKCIFLNLFISVDLPIVYVSSNKNCKNEFIKQQHWFDDYMCVCVYVCKCQIFMLYVFVLFTYIWNANNHNVEFSCLVKNKIKENDILNILKWQFDLLWSDLKCKFYYLQLCQNRVELPYITWSYVIFHVMSSRMLHDNTNN